MIIKRHLSRKMITRWGISYKKAFIWKNSSYLSTAIRATN